MPALPWLSHKQAGQACFLQWDKGNAARLLGLASEKSEKSRSRGRSGGTELVMGPSAHPWWLPLDPGSTLLSSGLCAFCLWLSRWEQGRHVHHLNLQGLLAAPGLLGQGLISLLLGLEGGKSEGGKAGWWLCHTKLLGSKTSGYTTCFPYDILCIQKYVTYLKHNSDAPLYLDHTFRSVVLFC